jgi:hypothetical protein
LGWFKLGADEEAASLTIKLKLSENMREKEKNKISF